jgi:hypothetical protein
VYRRNVKAGDEGPFGAVNAVDGESRPIGTIQGAAVWPGGTYFTAAVMHAVGESEGRGDLVAGALTTGYGVYRLTYEDDRGAFWFDTLALWIPEQPVRYRGPQYMRSRAAWELLVAVKDPFPPGWAPTV